MATKLPQDPFEWQRWDMVITLVTLGVGLAVFFGEAEEDWEEGLGKRLTVYFRAHGQTCMVCYEAHLPHEGDIRNWSQQIGRQMCGELLEFSPYIDLQELGVVSRGRDSIKLFQAVIFLKKIPLKLNEQASTRESGQTYKCWTQGAEGQESEAWDSPDRHLPHVRN